MENNKSSIKKSGLGAKASRAIGLPPGCQP